jgi:hypothetical protein
MTDQELRDLVASLAEAQKATDLQLKETGQQIKATDQQLREMVRDLGRQIGGLGEKFGSFTEGLALPSMTKILTQRFQMDVIAPRVLARSDGRSMEVDVMAYSERKPENEVFLVEVKSHLREEALEQMRRMLREFHEFFPGHAGKKVYGMLATVDAPAEVREKVLREGIYLARIHDGQFELQVPDDFQPRAF